MAAIGLVVGNPGSLSASDAVLQSVLEGDGHTVNLVDDTSAVPGGQDCYVISESGSPTQLGTKYTALTVPVVTCEVGGWDDMSMTTVNGTPLTGGAGTTTDLLAHDITTGLADPLTIYTASAGRYGVDTSALGAGAAVFAQHPTTTSHRMGFAYDTGAALVGGGGAPARRVALPYIDSATLAAGGQQLLLNAVGWALDAGPADQSRSLSRIAVSGDLRPLGRNPGPTSRALTRVAADAALRPLDASPGAVTRTLDRLAASTSVRPLQPTLGAASRALSRVTATGTARGLAAAPGPVTRLLDRIGVSTVVRALRPATVVDRDITILATTEPTSAWTAGEPTSGWAATEGASAWAATEPATGWQTSDPHL